MSDKEIKTMRLSANLTQRQLAKKIGISQPVLARMESPKNKYEPRLHTLRRIATACGREMKMAFPKLTATAAE
jgi:transcriptional regulator with XRE-family HTH domain